MVDAYPHLPIRCCIDRDPVLNLAQVWEKRVTNHILGYRLPLLTE